MIKCPQLGFRLWIRASLKRQLAIAFGSMALVAMLALAGLLLRQQWHFLDEANMRRAMALANGLARSSESWVLANDLVGLDEIVQGYIDTPSLEHIFILDPGGKVLASTQSGEVGRYLNDSVSLELLKQTPESRILIVSKNLIDVAAPVVVEQRHVGWARVELNQDDTKASLRALAVNHFEFIGITSLVLIAASIWLGQRMSDRLRQLGSIAQRIADGERSVRAISGAGDEISHLAVNVNHMLDTITRSEQDLGKLNRVYAAWTECVNTIAREPRESVLLDRLCQILAETIGLRLVFIGFTDAMGDWVDIAAASDWELSFLKTLKMSARADRPEGQGSWGRALRSQHPEIVNDFQSSPTTGLWHAIAAAESIRSVATFPLSRGGKIVGGIAVYSIELDFFNADMIALLNGLSIDISFALDNIDRETQRRQTETELRLAASVFDNSQEGIIITDAQEVIIRVNSSFSKLSGYSPSEVLGQTPRIMSSGSHDALFYQAMWERIGTQGYWQGEVINRRKNGELFPEWLCITRVLDADGCVTHYVGTFVDITDRKLDEERIHKLAFYDPLTQLPNRRLLIERLRQALVESQRSQLYGALMFMDLDRFKILNDTQGHDMGDQLLIEAGKRISECVREQDTVARLGGDEFVVMLEALADDQSSAIVIAQRIGDKLLASLRQPYQLSRLDREGLPASVMHHSSASIGMTLFQGAAIHGEDLLKQADVAMYQAKQAGRNKLCAYNIQMQAHINARAVLETELRQALQDKQFTLYYQVQVDVSGKVLGAEVLLRWLHPLRGWVAPADFIPLAEETGLINELGEWILAESCKTLAAWAQSPVTSDLTLAINISAKQFNQHHFVEQLAVLIGHYGCNPQLLTLEVTESLVLGDVEEALAKIGKLQGLGVSVSMDDFGTGYSSLAYLQRLPLSQLKIDRSFVGNVLTNSHDAAIIRTILLLGDSLGIDVIAEGVETEQQRLYLLANGCRYFQGFLFGPPEPLPDFERRIDELALS